MNILHSTLSRFRDQYAPSAQSSTFRSTGQITHEEFVAAGDYLVYKFPTWSWADASPVSRRDIRLPGGKQFLVTRGVPCQRRLDENFAGTAGQDDAMIADGEHFRPSDTAGTAASEDDGWLTTGGLASWQGRKTGDVRTVDDSGNMGEEEDDEEDIPDMEDEEDDEDAIIREPQGSQTTTPLRNYTLYITYSNYYRTPRLYLSGYTSANIPLNPHLMMEDIVGDYKDKTVTLEDFPYFSNNIKMASVHPCKHASVMKTLLDRADAALKLKREKLSRSQGSNRNVHEGTDGLSTRLESLAIGAKSEGGFSMGANFGGSGNEEWEVLPEKAGGDEHEVAIRADQYLVVFLKFISSVTPGIEHDFTMGV